MIFLTAYPSKRAGSLARVTRLSAGEIQMGDSGGD
jgi:hypothetical protein